MCSGSPSALQRSLISGYTVYDVLNRGPDKGCYRNKISRIQTENWRKRSELLVTDDEPRYSTQS